MVIVKGKIASVETRKTKRDNNPYKVLMIHDEKMMRYHRVSDFDNRNWEIGKPIEIPVQDSDKDNHFAVRS